MKAVFFGSIGSIFETSEIQREAFNKAFEKHGLDWSWDQEEYQLMLKQSGGAQRITSYAATKGVEVDAKAIHHSKTEVFHELLASRPIAPRKDVVDVFQLVRERGLKLGFLTTTEAKTVSIITAKLKALGVDNFDVLTSRAWNMPDKPDPAPYQHALDILRISEHEAIVIEDNADGVSAAKALGLYVIAFPGVNTSIDDMQAADVHVTDSLMKTFKAALETTEKSIT